MVKTNMERGTSIPTQSEQTTTLVVTTPSLDVAIVDPGVDVRVEETKAIIMEE
jgi:hypothetical protein